MVLQKQLNSAALQFVEGYLLDIHQNGETTAGFGPGIQMRVSGIDVTPTNAATAALYSYTPHIHGNKNFARIWDRYFALGGHPNGSLLQDKKTGGVFLVEQGKKRPITSKTALVTRFDPQRILPVSEGVLNQFTTGKPIAHANYTLMKSPTGDIYLLVDRELRRIPSVEIFHKIGFVFDEVEDVSHDEIAYYDHGDPLTAESTMRGQLIQNTTTGGVAYLQDGVGYPIVSKDILHILFSDSSITQMQDEQFSRIQLHDPVQLPDGMLVRIGEENAVYVISDTTLRAIPDETTFFALGWNWELVTPIGTEVLNAHTIGAPLDRIILEV